MKLSSLGILVGALVLYGSCGSPQPPVRFYETEPIGPPPSHIEIYKDGQGVWHIIIEGDRVCSCKPM